MTPYIPHLMYTTDVRAGTRDRVHGWDLNQTVPAFTTMVSNRKSITVQIIRSID